MYSKIMQEPLSIPTQRLFLANRTDLQDGAEVRKLKGPGIYGMQRGASQITFVDGYAGFGHLSLTSLGNKHDLICCSAILQLEIALFP